MTIPSKETDKAKLGQVGIIALFCFAIGVAWPTLAGVRLVPEPPNKAAEREHDEAAPKPRKQAPLEEPGAEVPVAANAPREIPRTTETQVAIDETLVVNCRDGEDRKLNDCDKPAFEDVATDRLKALVACEEAQGAAGVLSIGFDLDFDKKKITRVLRGKSTTLSEAMTDALIECAKREFLSATLQGIRHTHPRYLMFYMVRFVPPGAPTDAEETSNPIVEATGTATVVWNSAQLRSTPETGEVTTRLVYGTKVIVTGRQGDWYRVKYDARGSEAWVHKNALAL